MDNQLVTHVLFLCAGNSATSIMAEAIMNWLGNGRFIGHSAGRNPRGEVHGRALALLRQKGYDVSGLRSKSLEEFAALASMREASPAFDFVITLSEAVLDETAPVLPGCPAVLHWEIPNPHVARDPAIFEEAYFVLKDMISKFVASSVPCPVHMAS